MAPSIGCQFGWSVAEGCLWGVAVWLKPHVLLPAAAGVLAAWCGRVVTDRRSGVQSRRASRHAVVREIAADWGGLLFGGSLVGALGCAWLYRQEAWPYLWSTLTQWNPEYVAASSDRWSWGRFWSIQERLAPWSLIHIFALPAAVMAVVRLLFGNSSGPVRKLGDGAIPDPAILISSACYLAWLGQAFWLQHLFDYVYVPPLVWGALVVGASVRQRTADLAWTPQIVAAMTAVCVLPAFASRADQMAWWPQCVTEGSTTRVRAALGRLPVPDWPALAQVRDYLAGQHVIDGELTAYHTHTVHLYPWLGVAPSTRYVFTETHLRLFPKRAAEIEQALARSSERFVVSCLLEAGASGGPDWRSECQVESLARFPFNQPVVFRAGPYLVHRIVSGPGPMETGFFPLAAKSAGL